ncbi:MRGRD protein, partial [Trogon melanurus]|nr:MRGRD protein [Trogon melanurus]
ETNTTIFSLSNVTYGYEDYWEEFYSYCSGKSYEFMVFSGVCVGVSVFGLVGNGKVVWLLGFRVKQNPFTVYILNLAVADFFLLLIFFLLMLGLLTFTVLCLDDFLYFYAYFGSGAQFLCHFFDLSSLGLLTAISVERCVSVL